MRKHIHECEAGESFTCEGSAKITFVNKSGRKARMIIESDSPIHFKKPMAQECHDSLENVNHGDNSSIK